MSPVIDNWAHIGGLIGGAACAYYFGPRLYMMDVPEFGRVLVDKPIFRLPKSIESIPEKVGKRFQRMTRRLQVNTHIADLPAKPWRLPRGNRPNYKRRQGTPNRSIKPKDF